MNSFLWGAGAALSLVAASFFLRFWRRTRESLFLAFSAGFAVFSAHWVGLGIVNPHSETRHYLYVVRFVAFALFIAGVIAKNRASRSS